MPRLRQAKTKEEAEAVPVDQPIQIVLGEEVETDQGPTSEPSGGGSSPATKVEAITPPPPPHEPEDKPDVSALQKQLEATQKAEKVAQEALAAAQRREQAARQRAEELETQSNQHQERASQAEYDAIINALDGQREAAESAKRDIKTALDMGDTAAQAEAFDRLSRANANLTRLEDGKLTYEARIEAAKNAPKPQPRQEDRFEAAIAQLPPGAQNWLRAHPEYITDRAKNEDLQYFHQKAIREDKARFDSAEYYESLEYGLGLKERPKAEPTDEDDEDEVEVVQPKRSKVVTQAPPSRESVSMSTGKAVSTKIDLTPEERALAKSSNLTDAEYAKQKLKLQQLKKNGHYNESR